jgi:hypothetical protein
MIVFFCLLVRTQTMIRETVPDKTAIFWSRVSLLSSYETQDSGIVIAVCLGDSFNFLGPSLYTLKIN